MFKRLLPALLLCVSLGALADAPKVVITTNLGKITVQLNPEKAPVTVKNFLAYVDKGEYDGTIFHRVIPGFMIQGGGLTRDLTPRPEGEAIHNEADNGLKNTVGTIAMARMNDIDSATRQFFINVADNTHLDHTPQSCTRKDMDEYAKARERGLYKPMTCKNFGYAVFGHVVSGMDVVHRIEGVATQAKGGYQNLPVEPVVIESIKQVGGAPAKPAQKPTPEASR